MKKILNVFAGILAVAGLILLVADATDNALVFWATKIGGAAVLFIASRIFEHLHPEILDEEV